MMFSLFILWIALTCAYAKNSYFITIPKELRPGSPLRLGVNILNVRSNVRIEAQLVLRSTIVISSKKATLRPDSTNILMIPVRDDIPSGSYTVRVKGRGGSVFNAETRIRYQSQSVTVFIQTDKSIYNAGQTVNFRVFVMYPDMTMYYGPMNIDIYDPHDNKIKQWKHVSDNSGVFTGSLIMDSSPLIGTWQIRVNSHGRREVKSFIVKQYVLPKFEVNVQLPSYITTREQYIHGALTAIYTFGKPVSSGEVKLRAQLDHWYYGGRKPRVELDVPLGRKGRAKFKIPLSKIMPQNMYLTGRKLQIEANVTEGLTNVTLTSTNNVQITTHMYKVEFINAGAETFKPGLPFRTYLRISNKDKSPVSDLATTVGLKTKIVKAREKHDYLPDRKLTVTASGIIQLDINIPARAVRVHLEVKYKSLTLNHAVKRCRSPSKSYIQLTSSSTNLKAGDKARFSLKSTEPMRKVIYQVWSRGTIVSTRQLNGLQRKQFSFSITVEPDMSPEALVVVYYVRTNGEVVIDSLSLKVDVKFKNKVSVAFNKGKAKPAEDITVTVKADRKSHVFLLVVDKSTLLLQSGNDITTLEVEKKISRYQSIVSTNGYPTHSSGTDAYRLIKNLAVNVITDATIYKYTPPPQPQSQDRFLSLTQFDKLTSTSTNIRPQSNAAFVPNMIGHFNPLKGDKKSAEMPKRIRTKFPETWIFANGTISGNGRVEFQSKLPDTITSWVASAFAVNKLTGLGIASTYAEMTGFKSFFVTLNLPASVIRGEELALQVSVFNYQPTGKFTMIILKNSDDFQSIVKTMNGGTEYVSQTETESAFVPSGEAYSRFFPIVPTRLGPITIEVIAITMMGEADGVRRQLLVEPEGLPKEKNTPIALGLSSGRAFSKNVRILIPSSAVVGSERVKLSVIGDFMGPTIHNLESLLRMPTGCGEQTMLGLAPDVFVLDYLHKTKQLSKDLKKKLVMYTEKGYQRELKYQRKDGSFSAFGDSDRSGSMWLSAFVVKTFHKAKKHIFIDKNVFRKTIRWMINRQKRDGSFPEPGRVIHTDMQGGSGRGISLTAYVLIALEELDGFDDSALQRQIKASAAKALQYLERNTNRIFKSYDLAISSYALTLADSSAATGLFTKLNRHARVNGDMRYFSQSKRFTKKQPINIEMTSYALLVYSYMRRVGDGLGLLRWLMAQRNPNGGFISTQDTVLALQSMSEFSVLVRTQDPDMRVSITAGNFKKTFTVNSANALVLQSVELPHIPQSVKVVATGKGLAVFELAEFFHIKKDNEKPAFSVTVNILEDKMDSIQLQTCTRRIRGRGNGMAIQEIGIPSGFQCNIEEIPPVAGVRKTEEKDRKIVFYFDEITTRSVCVQLKAVRTGMVVKMQPMVVRVYDYYDPSNQVTTFYESKALKDSSVCDICHQCRHLCRRFD